MIKKHFILSRSFKEAFSENSVKFSDCRAFSLFKTIPGCRAYVYSHSEFRVETNKQTSDLQYSSWKCYKMLQRFLLLKTILNNAAPTEIIPANLVPLLDSNSWMKNNRRSHLYGSFLEVLAAASSTFL